jgi:hypothetical protein
MGVRRQVRAGRAAGVGIALLAVVLTLPAMTASAGAAPEPTARDASSYAMPANSDSSHNYSGVVADSPTDAFAVGVANDFGRSRIRHWDGHQWVLDHDRNSNASGFSGVDASGPSDVWAVGSWLGRPGSGIHPLAVRWDGTGWHRTNAPDAPQSAEDAFAAVSVIGPDDVWAVGAYHIGEGGDISLVEHWDGSSWTVLDGPANTPDMYSVLAFSDTDVWAAAGDQGVDHWNGRTWKVYTPNEGIQAVSGTGPHDVWAVGAEYPHTFAEHWDGHSWTATSTPDGSHSASSLTAVSAVSADDVWAVGGSWNMPGIDPPAEAFMEHWDGQHWTLVDVPNPGATFNRLNSISLDSATDGWAVGRYTSGSDNSKGRVLFLHWDGTRWTKTRL